MKKENNFFVKASVYILASLIIASNYSITSFAKSTNSALPDHEITSEKNATADITGTIERVDISSIINITVSGDIIFQQYKSESGKIQFNSTDTTIINNSDYNVNIYVNNITNKSGEIELLNTSDPITKPSQIELGFGEADTDRKKYITITENMTNPELLTTLSKKDTEGSQKLFKVTNKRSFKELPQKTIDTKFSINFKVALPE